MALKFSEIVGDIEYDVQERMEQLEELKDLLRDLAEAMDEGPDDDDIDGSVDAIESDVEYVMSTVEELLYTGPSVQRDWNQTLAKVLEYYREEYA
jgi:hypothetical protein